jgi:crotonobetainyl-CoA:carnitine CoA-transferase CaiB-like acyl-CoA transferase
LIGELVPQALEKNFLPQALKGETGGEMQDSAEMAQKTNTRGPLSDVVLLDLTRALAGPYCSMILADLGAETVKIEAPNGREQIGGPSRLSVKGQSSHFLAHSRNKKSLCIDLKRDEGKQIFYELTEKADVVLDNFRPGVIEKMGLEYESLSKINPRIICCSISGFGSTGRLRNRPAYDLIAQAMSGVMSITGEPPPVRSGPPIGDMCAGMFAAHGIMTALYERERTGCGQKVETSLLTGQIALLGYMVLDYFLTGENPAPVGLGQRSSPQYHSYRVKDGHVAVAAVGPERFWVNLCKAIDREDIIKDPRFDTAEKRMENADQIIAIMEGIFIQRTVKEWMDRLVAADVPCGPVNTIEQALNEPQILDQNMVVDVEFQGERIKMAGSPIKMSGTPIPMYNSPPLLGEHTDQILSMLLKYDKEKIEKLRQERVII